MNVFLMHIGHPGNVDIDFTITRKRSINGIVDSLPADSLERDYFVNDRQLHEVFPSGEFNCWGVPDRAEPSFERTRVGDVVLFIPSIGIHPGSGIRYIGVVEAKCPVRCDSASAILWPETPGERLFPWLFFFETEEVYRGWFEFLDDVGYESDWNPHGWYRRVQPARFFRWGGPEGYVEFLRKNKAASYGCFLPRYLAQDLSNSLSGKKGISG